MFCLGEEEKARNCIRPWVCLLGYGNIYVNINKENIIIAPITYFIKFIVPPKDEPVGNGDLTVSKKVDHIWYWVGRG